MKQFLAFSKKEFIENWRTGRIVLLGSLTTVFGIMNPLIAKLTPYLVQSMTNNLAEVGVKVGEIKIDAFTSWGQFYKNFSVFLFLFLLLFSTTLTNEYQKKTLINLLTKGMIRWKIYVSKWLTGLLFWTLSYWGCYLITYIYTAIYWNNLIIPQLEIKSFYAYLWGIWLYSLFLCFSSFFSSSSLVLVSGGISVAGLYLFEMFSKSAHYSPLYLMSGSNILKETIQLNDYWPSLIITCLTILLFLIVGILVFNKKEC
jgi:ABC-2 type transport system permease protein